jgi:predicted  nucleic acid-binding Zn-ribbon protein
MAYSNKEDVQAVDQIKAIRKEPECLKLNYDFLVSKSEASSTNSSHRIDSLQKENQVLKTKLEKLSSEHVTLQGTHVDLKKSYEKLVE